MAPFFYLPHTLFVAELGLDHFDLSMKAQYELTKPLQRQASIRPYIARDPSASLAVLRGWTKDPKKLTSAVSFRRHAPAPPWAGRVAWLDTRIPSACSCSIS
jgi:3-methyladenine DNA glycosylase AlkC